MAEPVTGDIWPCCGLTSGYPNRESAMVVIREGVRDGNGKKRGGVWADPCIAPLVAALNAAGIPTVASCCGHGKHPGRIDLRDGRVLTITQEGTDDPLANAGGKTIASSWWDESGVTLVFDDGEAIRLPADSIEVVAPNEEATDG